MAFTLPPAESPPYENTPEIEPDSKYTVTLADLNDPSFKIPVEDSPFTQFCPYLDSATNQWVGAFRYPGGILPNEEILREDAIRTLSALNRVHNGSNGFGGTEA